MMDCMHCGQKSCQIKPIVNLKVIASTIYTQQCDMQESADDVRAEVAAARSELQQFKTTQNKGMRPTQSRGAPGMRRL